MHSRSLVLSSLMLVFGCSFSSELGYPREVKGSVVADDGGKGDACQLQLMHVDEGNPAARVLGQWPVRTGEPFAVNLTLPENVPPPHKQISFVIDCQGFVPSPVIVEWNRWDGISIPTLDIKVVRVSTLAGR